MTIAGAMADDMDALQGVWAMNFFSPIRDEKGRKVTCCDRSMIDPKKYGRERLVRDSMGGLRWGIHY
jgi:hypothetical protein